MYQLCRVRCYNFISMWRVQDLLYKSGRDMAKRFGLEHWNNSRLKTSAIVCLCMLKNEVYLCRNADGQFVATLQLKKQGQAMHLAKLAVSSTMTRRGIGVQCLKLVEQKALQRDCKTVECEVYEASKHAISFYEQNGYKICGTVETLKYREFRMQKCLIKDDVS